MTIKRICNKCSVEKTLTSFHRAKNGLYGREAQCIPCRNKRKQTKVGLIGYIFNNQKYHSKTRGHVAPYYTKEELIEWCMAQENFERMYSNWVSNNFSKDTKPTCDRLDDYLPYTLDNLQLLTWKENKDKYALDAKEGRNTKTAKAVICYDLNGKYIAEYHSIIEASRVTLINRTSISKSSANKDVTAGGYIWRLKPDKEE